MATRITTASTPPPTSSRAHTPPAPLHGACYDAWEPYSPRRSKRVTAQSNPFSSMNTDRSPHKTRASRTTTPPPVSERRIRRTSDRTITTASQLSSPPSSPDLVPSRSAHISAESIRQTPRRPLYKLGTGEESIETPNSSRRGVHKEATDSTNQTNMLPTPSKTPQTKRHRPTTQGTARILNFQPNDPNDVMPSSRKMKGPSRPRSEFNVIDEEIERQEHREIAIYTDNANRVPHMDESDDNPFVGKRQSNARNAQNRSSPRKKSAAVLQEEREMEEAARRNEGVVYQFRGRKIFKRFSSPPAESSGEFSNAEEAPTDIEEGKGHQDSFIQRDLKNKAGAAAQRRLTRSNFKPRLLFPAASDDQESREVSADDSTNARADTEMINIHLAGTASSSATFETPNQVRFKNVDFVEEDLSGLLSPPPTKGKKHGGKSGSGGTLFDNWPRSKSASRKRAGGEVDGEGSSKRSRSIARSPA